METQNRDKQPATVKKWLTAVRPFAYTASVLPVLLGLALAFYEGHTINWVNFILTIFGVVCFQSATNLINDCYDYKRGLDKVVTPVSGAVVRGWITVRQAITAAVIFMAVGCFCGIYLVMVAGWPVLLLGIVGVVIALGYTRNGVCLKYAGLGDLSVFMALGILPVLGSYWVQVQQFSWTPVLWSPVISLFTVAILHANNWRDIDSDKNNACRTVAGILGDGRSSIYYKILVLSPFAIIAILMGLSYLPCVSFDVPTTTLVVFLSLPLIIKLTKINSKSDMNSFVMLDGKTAQAQLVFGLLLVAGFFGATFVTS